MDGKAGTALMVGQMAGLLNKLEKEDYTRALPVLGGATLGQHFRHIIDFYRSLLRDIPAGVIDYSRRERETRLEVDIAAAQTALKDIDRQARRLDVDRRLQVRTDFSDQSKADRPEVASSIGRELMYAYDHALHHLAIIRIGVQAARPDLPLEEKLGVAPSTLKYQRERKEN